MHEIQVRQHFSLELSELFERLSEHENLNTVFAPAKVSRLADGDTERNGVGSRRKIAIAPGLTIQETVTAFERDALIQYTITKGGAPISEHLGTLRFQAAPSGGSDLVYTIALGSKVPGAAKLVGAALRSSIKRGLPKIDR